MLTKKDINENGICTTWTILTVLANWCKKAYDVTKGYSINTQVVNNGDRKIKDFQPNISKIGVTNAVQSSLVILNQSFKVTTP